MRLLQNSQASHCSHQKGGSICVNWGLHKAFQNLKQAMMNASVLRHFNLNCQAILETDTSDLVTGEILFQYDKKGVLHPVTFYNKSMILVECNYHIYNKELLAIIHCFKHWCSELEHTDLPIQVFTDHQALKTFMENKELTHQHVMSITVFLAHLTCSPKGCKA